MLDEMGKPSNSENIVKKQVHWGSRSALPDTTKFSTSLYFLDHHFVWSSELWIAQSHQISVSIQEQIKAWHLLAIHNELAIELSSWESDEKQSKECEEVLSVKEETHNRSENVSQSHFIHSSLWIAEVCHLNQGKSLW